MYTWVPAKFNSWMERTTNGNETNKQNNKYCDTNRSRKIEISVSSFVLKAAGSSGLLLPGSGSIHSNSGTPATL